MSSPAVIAFALGLLAATWGTSLRLPNQVCTLLSTYLLLAIGFKGGVAIGKTPAVDLVGPAGATIGIGVVTPLIAFVVLRRMGRFSMSDSAAIAAHYGSVSVVTFTAATTAAVAAGLDPESFMPALVVLLEVPGIAIALLLAQSGSSGDLKAACREAFAGHSVVLLGGGCLMGVVANPASVTAVEPFLVGLFPGMLVLFLLDLGTKTGERLGDVRKSGAFLIGFAIAMPLLFGAIGLAAGALVGLSTGGSAVLAIMAASASYIAAPAAVSIALPGANPALGLSAALGVTFPFNLVVGIPILIAAAKIVV
ncbi:MAG: sodium-dependent bicarbonate transport family permease [Microthrixaceae bacterium]